MITVFNWLSINWMEVLAVLISLVYVVLSVRQIRWLWAFGFVSAVLYAGIYYRSGFYAGMGLQVYYLVISIYGWIIWSRGKTTKQAQKPLPVTSVTRTLGIRVLTAFVILWLIIAVVLDRLTDSTIPLWDALTTAGGIMATWMLARKILENWLLWIFVDSVSVGLYIWKGLYPTAILFGVYIVMAVLGYREWKKSLTAA